jgi:hypothetical protein
MAAHDDYQPYHSYDAPGTSDFAIDLNVDYSSDAYRLAYFENLRKDMDWEFKRQASNQDWQSDAYRNVLEHAEGCSSLTNDDDYQKHLADDRKRLGRNQDRQRDVKKSDQDRQRDIEKSKSRSHNYHTKSETKSTRWSELIWHAEYQHWYRERYRHGQVEYDWVSTQRG